VRKIEILVIANISVTESVPWYWTIFFLRRSYRRSYHRGALSSIAPWRSISKLFNFPRKIAEAKCAAPALCLIAVISDGFLL
jgi:hypothetical protein